MPGISNLEILSAGINFGKPENEFIVEATKEGEAISCRNVRTGIEYIGGGGGDSDFSVAEVTFVNNTNLEAFLLAGYLGELPGGGNTLLSMLGAPALNRICLYNSNAVCQCLIFDEYVPEGYEFIITGSIEQIGITPPLFLITGNGTIEFIDIK